MSKRLPASPMLNVDKWFPGLSGRDLSARFIFDPPAAFFSLAGGGLPLGTIPGSKLEPGHAQPAVGLTAAERRADQALAARSLLVPAGDSRGTSVA